jgi:hypothetical protein
MLIAPDHLANVWGIYQETLKLLEELKAIGFPYKCVAFFLFEPGSGHPRWRGFNDRQGIVLFPSSDAGALAHEMGHGFHECLRDKFPNGLTSPMDNGEAVAQAIRFFVRERYRQTTGKHEFEENWNDHTNWDVLKQCNESFDQFKAKLRALAPPQPSKPETR